MKRDNLEVVSLLMAFKDPDLFYCPKLDIVAERNAGMCGKFCDHYAPRNGKGGMCRHNKTAHSAYPKKRYILSSHGIIHGPVISDNILSEAKRQSAILDLCLKLNAQDPDRSLL